MYYTDANGKKRRVRLTIGICDEVAEMYGIDLLDTDYIETIASDLCELVRTVLAVAAVTENVSENTVVCRTRYDAMERLIAAFAAELKNFFPEVEYDDKKEDGKKEDVSKNEEPKRKRDKSLRQSVWEMAGVVGCNPRDLSVRQLSSMTTGQIDVQMIAASNIMAVVANCHSVTKGQTFKPSDFYVPSSGYKKPVKQKGLPATEERLDQLQSLLESGNIRVSQF